MSYFYNRFENYFNEESRRLIKRIAQCPGTGFFVSWWLLEPPSGCLVQMFSGFPVLSALARAMVKPWTYYRIDTATMFRTATHQAVLEVVDQITTSQPNVKSLPEADRKPILREFFPQ